MTTAAQTSIAPESALVINPADLGITATGAELIKLFVQFTNRHSESPWQFELSPNGEIIIMAPTYYPGGLHENAASSILFMWAMDFGGEATGSNAAYEMPVTGGVVAPDAAWTSRERWAACTHVAGRPIALCPEFVIEVRSGTDNLAPLHAKMQLYMKNGALLGWLIDARDRRVHIYLAGRTEPELLENPATLSGEDVLPGFTFDVARWIFDRV